MVILLANTASAQNNIRFHRLNEQQGLTSAVVNDIAQDTLGFIWVGTDDGLFRFDGAKFTPFRELGTRIAIPNNTINKIKVDRNNRVWILTNDGLGCYSYADDSIKQYYPTELGNSPYEKTFTAITESEDGIIFIGSTRGGLYTFENNKLNRLSIDDHLISSDFNALNISDLAFQNGRLLIATWYNGLMELDFKTTGAKLVPIDDRTNERLHYDLFQGVSENVWSGTDKGIQRLTPSDSNGHRVENIAVLGNEEVLGIIEDIDQTLWAGTRNNGLYQLRPTEDGGTHAIVTNYMAGLGDNMLPHRTVSKVFEDMSGNIWLGTHGKGLVVFDPRGERVAHMVPPFKDLLADNNITSVWGMGPSTEGGIWLGTDGAGLYHYDIKKNDWVKYASTKGPRYINDDNILSLLQTSRSEVWLGTYEGGLFKIDIKSNLVTNYRADGNRPMLLSNDVRSIHQDSDKTVWVGTNRGGLHYYDRSKDKIVPIPNTKSLDVRSIVADPIYDDFLWLATYGDGLVKFNKKNGAITRFDWSREKGKEIPIALCAAYHRNSIWVGTKNRGLRRFDLKSQKFEDFSNSGKLNYNTIRNIVPSGKDLVLSTNDGISMIDMETGKSLNFTSIDGLNFGQFNDGSGFYSNAGYLVFGGIHGLYAINLSLDGADIADDANKAKFKSILALLEDQNLPKVVFTELSYNNEEVTPDNHEVIEDGLPIAQSLRFGPELDVFSIRFSTLDFRPYPTRNYSYILEGHDTKWIGENIDGSASYRNVPPGDYVFKARISDPATGQQGPISTLAIHVAPPWWQTGWAYTGFAVLTLLLLGLGYRYNKERITMRQKLFYEKKIRQQENASMQEKMRFYTNFSHELKTPITLIMGPINDLLRSAQLKNDQKHSLLLVKRNAHTLLKLINRLLDFRKIETENINLNIGNYDLSALAKEEAESFGYLAKEREITFGFYSETELSAWVDIEKIQIVLNNLLSNALKFSEKGGKVTFSAYSEGDNVRFDVQDVGQGIAGTEIHSIFKPFYQAENSTGKGGTGLGLSFSKNLVEFHGGSLLVKSEPGLGSVFSALIPKGRSHYKGKANVKFIEPQKGEIAEVVDNKSDAFGAQTKDVENDKVLLVVDDNQDIRHYVGSLFQNALKVVYAENGKKGLEISKEISPDIIISDVMMPEMDGFVFCSEIKKHISTSHIPVLLLTAKDGNQSIKKGFEGGADDYIAKPFDSEILIARVNNLLAGRAQLKKLFENGQWLDTKEGNTSELDFLKKVETTVLEMMPSGNLNVVQLCRELGFSRTSLYRKVKSLTGMSINQLIRSIKLKKAAEMLTNEDMNVSEVAFSLDFTDLKYFRNSFKEQFGVMPSEFLNQNKSTQEPNKEELKRKMGL